MNKSNLHGVKAYKSFGSFLKAVQQTLEKEHGQLVKKHQEEMLLQAKLAKKGKP